MKAIWFITARQLRRRQVGRQRELAHCPVDVLSHALDVLGRVVTGDVVFLAGDLDGGADFLHGSNILSAPDLRRPASFKL